jgi:hypothetical protein
MAANPSPKQSRLLVLILAVIVVVAVLVLSPFGRRMAGDFFSSLRVQKVQAVNINLSNFTGPNADPALRQMVTQMISDKVKVTVNQKGQPAADPAMASQLAGFHVELLSARKDKPQLAVAGEHALDLTIDRARLQEILKEAGRSDLKVPESIDGEMVEITIPRTVMARYGDCPAPPSATANVATPPPNTLQYSNCVLLREGPSPIVNVPPGVDFEKVAQIALQVAGMTQTQSQQFLQTVNWKQTLGVSIPRFMRSYEAVKVNGVQGTLLNTAGRRGPTYALVWAKKGMVYSLTGFGDSTDAVTLANSLQ